MPQHADFPQFAQQPLRHFRIRCSSRQHCVLPQPGRININGASWPGMPWKCLCKTLPGRKRLAGLRAYSHLTARVEASLHLLLLSHVGLRLRMKGKVNLQGRSGVCSRHGRLAFRALAQKSDMPQCKSSGRLLLVLSTIRLLDMSGPYARGPLPH